MKKIFFLFAMLTSVAASAQVTHVEPVGANYANSTVSFHVWWNAGTRDATHLSKIWVWVDYIMMNSNNTTSGNSWTRATVGTITVSIGATSYDGTNRNGFWLEGNASTNYSATLTVQLTNVPAKFNWCAYASDYPPNVTANNGTYTFKGTPPFILTASNGTTTQTVTGNTLAASALTITPTTIRDKTECPGIFCLYQGSDLYVDATHLCQQRTSGAKNWEAYIKDSRDGQIYHITQFSDNTWWFAQDLATANNRIKVCSGTSLYDPSSLPNCPAGWSIPTYTQMMTRWPNSATIDQFGGMIVTDVVYNNNGCLNTSYAYMVVNNCINLWVMLNNNTWVWDNYDIGGSCNNMKYRSYGKIRCYR
ncbi:MAG: hypothetical protein LBG31_03040 [Prevotellaceae bacterium]|jgi:hypothetical protein|nr:hypothetical protein [Prevotellaceae bacterium]